MNVRLIGAICAFAVFGGATAAMAQTAGPLPTSLERERSALGSASAAAQKDDADEKALAAAMKDILADPTFPALTEDERHTAYLLYGALLFDLSDNAGAKPMIDQATAMPQATGFDWALRLQNSFKLSDFADAGMAMTVLAKSWPDKLGDFNDRAITRVAREIDGLPASRTALVTMLGALYTIHWQPKDAFFDSDELWLTLARLRLDDGDVAGAKLAIAELHNPTSFIEMRADKRFDDIVGADPAHFDVEKGYEAELVSYKAKSAAAPDKLEGVNTVAEVLLAQGRADQALALSDDALARMSAKPDVFSDKDDQINWTLDIRSRALFGLGRSDEALAALAQGAAHREDGNVNVSQAINLADAYALYDRPKDALAAVAGLTFSNASPYGRMALEDARACALFELGDGEGLKPILAYMKAHVRDGQQPYLNTMLCTGDLDAAAAEVIASLDDPARRMAMLFSLQTYLPSPHPSARAKTIHAAWLAVRERTDVAAAIARVGRIGDYAVAAPTY